VKGSQFYITLYCKEVGIQYNDLPIIFYPNPYYSLQDTRDPQCPFPLSVEMYGITFDYLYLSDWLVVTNHLPFLWVLSSIDLSWKLSCLHDRILIPWFPEMVFESWNNWCMWSCNYKLWDYTIIEYGPWVHVITVHDFMWPCGHRIMWPWVYVITGSIIMWL